MCTNWEEVDNQTLEKFNSEWIEGGRIRVEFSAFERASAETRSFLEGLITGAIQVCKDSPLGNPKKILALEFLSKKLFLYSRPKNSTQNLSFIDEKWLERIKGSHVYKALEAEDRELLIVYIKKRYLQHLDEEAKKLHKYLLIFMVCSKYIRDHSVEVTVSCEPSKLAEVTQKEKKVIEERIKVEQIQYSSSNEGYECWVTVTLTQAVIL